MSCLVLLGFMFVQIGDVLLTQEPQTYLIHHGKDMPGHGKFPTELNCMHRSIMMLSL